MFIKLFGGLQQNAGLLVLNDARYSIHRGADDWHSGQLGLDEHISKRFPNGGRYKQVERVYQPGHVVANAGEQKIRFYPFFAHFCFQFFSERAVADQDKRCLRLSGQQDTGGFDEHMKCFW